VKLFQWPGRTSKKAFTERFQAALQERLPDALIEPSDELELRLTLADGYKQTVWLARAYREFCEAPADAANIIARWLGSVTQLENDTLDADRIIPVIKDHVWLTENGENGFAPWTEPYNSELIIVFAEYRGGLQFCDRKRFDDLRIPLNQLRERAFANLRRVITDVSVTGRDGRFLLGAGGTIDASLLLLDDVMNDPRIELAGEPLVGVSDRDSFWIADGANPHAVFAVAASVARCYASEPYPISRQLFHKVDATWQPLDPEPQDGTHPIPDLSVIDIVGTKRGGGADLVVIIAQPLGADARSLFRLFSKLDAYLREIESEQWRREHEGATPESTNIVVKLHPDSDPVVREVLESGGEAVKRRGARLRVEPLKA
jgi:uncharacterized protein YtpQ (UPF0354 family)